MLICFVCFLFSICSLSNSSLSRKFIVNAVWVCHPWDSFTRHGQCRVPVCIIILIWIATRGDTWNLNGKCESLRVWRVFYHLFVCYDRINELLSGQRTDRVFDCYVACLYSTNLTCCLCSIEIDFEIESKLLLTSTAIVLYNVAELLRLHSIIIINVYKLLSL